MLLARHPWYFETDCARDALAGRALLEHYLSEHAAEGADLFPASVAYGELLSNVIKHAPSSGVRVWLEPHGEKFALCITDAGPGFSERELPKLPGHRNETGRGLYIVKRICEEISYRRTEAGGFTVRVVLPIRRRNATHGALSRSAS